jgi:histidinol dehydrogenase
MLISNSPPREILNQRWPNKRKSKIDLRDYVAPILEEIKTRKDEALLKYTEKFDKIRLSPDEIKITKQDIEDAYSKVSKTQVKAIKKSKNRLEKVENRRLKGLNFNYFSEGVMIQSQVRPLASVGCYVPGGKASYPSSLIMNVIPAKVAGVQRIAITAPPRVNGNIDPLTLVAADLCDIDEIYRVGGIQAIGALAYGTDVIRSVEKIVGPGNKYVTEAKKIVSDFVSIDLPAGPSEILILADETTDPRLVALDLISQSEHGPDSISGLVTTSPELAKTVALEVQKMLKEIPNGEMVNLVLSQNGFIYTCNSLDEAIQFVNEFAPEHLEILISNPRQIVDKIQNAGLILLGPNSPVASTDYCMGVNHVLPTEGYGRIFSGLSVLDFLRIVNIIECSNEGLERVREDISALANAEGLPNHSLAVEGRFKK